MVQLFKIHPDNPQKRLILQVTAVLRNDGVIVYPTDSAYALGCLVGNKTGLERIRNIRKLDDNHNFTLVCHNLSELSSYARVDNTTYRLLKAYTPGSYTFILPASKEVPRRLMHPKRKTIGLRIPDNNIAMMILAELGEPLMSTTLILPGDPLPLADSEIICERLGNQVDSVVDCGNCGVQPTSVIGLTDGIPEIIRKGKGDITPFKR